MSKVNYNIRAKKIQQWKINTVSNALIDQTKDNTECEKWVN